MCVQVTLYSMGSFHEAIGNQLLSCSHVRIYPLLSSWLIVYFEHTLLCQFIFAACSGNGFVYIPHLKALDFLKSNFKCVYVWHESVGCYLPCSVDISCWPLLGKKKSAGKARDHINEWFCALCPFSSQLSLFASLHTKSNALFSPDNPKLIVIPNRV